MVERKGNDYCDIKSLRVNDFDFITVMKILPNFMDVQRMLTGLQTQFTGECHNLVGNAFNGLTVFDNYAPFQNTNWSFWLLPAPFKH